MDILLLYKYVVLHLLFPTRNKNIYHPEYPDKVNNRPRRDVSDPAPLPDPLPLLEVQRALDYVSKYGEPIPLEADTIYAEQHNNVTEETQEISWRTYSRYNLHFQRW